MVDDYKEMECFVIILPKLDPGTKGYVVVHNKSFKL